MAASIQRIEVRRDDITKTRLVEVPAPPLGPGEARVRVESFALTANNVTYAVVGEKIGYWRFFPAPDGWGIVPVWGVGVVAESRSPEVAEGERLYGYMPMAESFVVTPAKVSSERLFDASAHRRELPPVYNAYVRLNGEAGYDPATDALRSLLWPLYATSFCLYDFLVDNAWFGARRVIILSASSKTAIGLAVALADDPDAPETLGATSAGNRAFVESLDLYDVVTDYDGLEAIDPSVPSVIVDMSGHGGVLSKLHRRLGEAMRYCSNVGLTHWSENAMGPGFIRERSAMFFAPGHIQKRAKDWGPGVFDARAFAFWKAAAPRSAGSLSIRHCDGGAAAKAAFDRLVSDPGAVPPSEGLVVRWP